MNTVHEVRIEQHYDSDGATYRTFWRHATDAKLDRLLHSLARSYNLNRTRFFVDGVPTSLDLYRPIAYRPVRVDA